MIQILRQDERKRDSKVSFIVIQKPFHYLSRGIPFDLVEYRKWLFKKLLTNQTAIHEFTRMLDIVIQEGELILQCSCIPPDPCHGVVIKDALTWAEPFGIEGWHPELKRIAASNFAKARKR